MQSGTEQRREHSAKALFNEWAISYDATIKAEFEKSCGIEYEEYMGQLLSAVQVPRGGSVLDVATGTALMAIGVARKMDKDCRITAIDMTAAMLEQARHNLERSGMSDVITLKEGRAEVLPFGDLSFDVVDCSIAIHHTNVSKALSEIARVLKPGGQLVIADFLAPPAWQTFAGRIGVPVYRFMKRFSSDNLERADAGYAAIYPRRKWDKLLLKNRLEVTDFSQYPKAGVQQWEPIPFILTARKKA